jgi:cytochrome c-type biogenesis protein CcmF
MIPLTTLGHTLVLGALAMATAGSVVGFAAGYRRSARALEAARALGMGFATTIIAANLVMIAALVQHDFSVSYVAEVGSRSTPLHITIVSLWASLSGSILLWGGVLGAYVLGLIVALGGRYREYQGWTLGVLLAVCVMFSLLVAGVANPFAPTPPEETARLVQMFGAGPDGAPLDGPGPNPLLQNHWLMIIHPPTLYLGYVGMAVPFAMSAAALLAGRLDAGWMAPLRRAFLVPWGFLTVGILLGGWWSYAVLGWGGYWAWDPVENASFLPWLTGTAFLHSAMMMERRTSLKTWTLLLGMGTFLLTLFGTFLTRSGVFNSVHAFGTGTVGPVLLTFIAICSLFTVVLLALREHTLHTGAPAPRVPARQPRDDAALPPATRAALGVLLWACLVVPPAMGTVLAIRYAVAPLVGEPWSWILGLSWTPLLAVLLLSRWFLSRDFVIIAQNATFTVFTFVVFLGTTYPILVEALRNKRVSVGEPFFDAFGFPLGVLIVWMMGVGPMLPWGTSSIVSGWRRFLAPLSIAIVLSGAFALAGVTQPYTLLALFVCFMALAANLGELIWPAARRAGQGGAAAIADLLAKGRRRWGGHIAHYGVILCVASMALSKGYAVEKDLRFEKGQIVAFEDYELRYTGSRTFKESHRQVTVGTFDVLQGGQLVGVYEPALNKYLTRMEGLPSPAIRSTGTHDLYLSLMSVQDGGQAASLHLKRMPAVVWIWVSGLVIAAGTVLAVWPERRRRTAEAPADASTVAV